MRAPAVAVRGDLMLVAWTKWTAGDVELRRIALDGAVIGSWTLATGASSGHLSLSVGPHGALVTWLRPDPTPASTGAWVVAQLLASDGSPSGAPFEYRVSIKDDEYRRPAAATWLGDTYRVAYGQLDDGHAWLIVDPSARSITSAQIGDLTTDRSRSIESLVPDIDGVLVGLDGTYGSVVRVVDDRAVNVGWVGKQIAPAIALQPDRTRAARRVL